MKEKYTQPKTMAARPRRRRGVTLPVLNLQAVCAIHPRIAIWVTSSTGYGRTPPSHELNGGSRRSTASAAGCATTRNANRPVSSQSEEHTSELQSLAYLVCRLLLEKKNNRITD